MYWFMSIISLLLISIIFWNCYCYEAKIFANLYCIKVVHFLSVIPEETPFIIPDNDLFALFWIKMHFYYLCFFKFIYQRPFISTDVLRWSELILLVFRTKRLFILYTYVLYRTQKRSQSYKARVTKKRKRQIW